MQSASLPQFEKQLQEAFATVKEQLPLENGWKETDKNKKLGLVNHSKKDEKFNIGVTRGEGIIYVSAQKLANILNIAEEHQKIEKRLIETKLICTTPSGYEIRQNIFSPPIGDDRESINACGTFEENGTIYRVMVSVDHPEYEKAGKGKVRCIHHYFAYEIAPLGEKSCKVIYIACFDPKGSIPDFIKSKMNNSRGIEELEKIKKYVEQ